MHKLLFDELGNYVGQDREKMYTEREIYLQDLPNGLSKSVLKTNQQTQVNESGDTLYELAVQGGYVKKPARIESRMDTGVPVYVELREQKPVLDKKGKPAYMVQTREEETTERTPYPVMVNGVQQKNAEGKLLYKKIVELGEREYLYMEETNLVHKRDSKGYPLFWRDIEQSVYDFNAITYEHITRHDSRWRDDLPIVMTETSYHVNYTFEENPFLFTYEDIRVYKRDKQLEGTFCIEAFLMEEYKREYFDVIDKVDTLTNSVCVNPGGSMKIKPIHFVKPALYFKIIPELSKSGLVFTGYFINDETNEVEEIAFSNSLLEAITTVPYRSLSVKVENPTNQPITIGAVGIIS